jgi:RNA polymerase sigma factor (TIGR02999 family)
MESTPGDVTGALIALREGDDQAFDRLVQMVYADLKRIAHNQRRRGGRPASLETTALVNETYLRLVDQDRVAYNDRGHFFAAWARAMRHALVDEVRRGGAKKRGGDAVELPLDEARLGSAGRPEVVLAVDEALRRLGQHDPTLQRIVECRFFAGFTEAETAEALSTSLRSVQRGWWKARVWLGAELGSAELRGAEPERRLPRSDESRQ